MENKTFHYKCVYKCERCGAIHFGKEIKLDAEIDLSNIIINKERNYVAAISKNYEYVELSPIESVSHICKQYDNVVVSVGITKFIGIDSIDATKV